ncbi:MAG: hypothetical protein AAFN10_23270, partial [Bacteroidota bacterium]
SLASGNSIGFIAQNFREFEVGKRVKPRVGTKKRPSGEDGHIEDNWGYVETLRAKRLAPERQHITTIIMGIGSNIHWDCLYYARNCLNGQTLRFSCLKPSS